VRQILQVPWVGEVVPDHAASALWRPLLLMLLQRCLQCATVLRRMPRYVVTARLQTQRHARRMQAPQ